MSIIQVTDHSSSVSGQPLYEVFLSYRGPDMRRGFADILHAMLTDVGISVFKDEEELENGKEISPQLIQAIQQSKISIPVISKEYAFSESCLMKLEQMVQCVDKKKSIIIPIFYYVDPSDVRNCRGPFEKALDEHKKRNCMPALRRIGELEGGHHLHEKSEVSHGEVIKRIVHQIQQKLKKQDLIVPKHLLGIDSHVQGIMAMLKVDHRNGQAVKIGDSSVKVLGIFGIPGVGKTVLAKYVYNQLYHLFDACSFLGEIQAEFKHHSILSVQNKLISDLDRVNARVFDSSKEALFHIRKNFCTKKVLVLLDDVYDHEQLSALVGELDWLGSKSRVILTSQRQDVLRNINGAESFVLEPMKQDEALKLFYWHAFGTDSPRKEFEGLSAAIVDATGRLPLALEVTGSSLFRVKSKKAWRETLTALEVSPHKTVQAALGKSYADLDANAQKIFLDIACFFTGMDKRIPYYMWHDCEYFPSRMIPALQTRSLVKIGEDKKLLVHDILRKFGREIVKNESRDEPFKRSRVWDPEEAMDVLKRREGTKKVEALGLDFAEGSERDNSVKCDQFDGLQNLRFLKLDRANIRGTFADGLLNLRWLDWQGCPKNFDNQSLNLNVRNLVTLDLSGSQVDEDWSGWELLAEAMKLKVLKLTGCVQLTATPKFPASMELERLILEGCSKLAVIHPSVGNLTKLVSLNVKGCSLLRDLPDLGPIRSLKELVIDGTSISRINFQEGSMMTLKLLSACNCKDLTDISDSIGYLKSLQYLALDGSGIHTLPESIGSLEQLKRLSLKNCQRLTDLPEGIWKLRSLQLVDLSGTLNQKWLPTSLFPEVTLTLEKLEKRDLLLCRILE
ncbi:hypothetical protein EUGRSUZ_D00729, partial [Eucalyptus grandis]